jgi:hypothetical protein
VSDAFVLDVPRGVADADVEDTLWNAFRQILDAIDDERTVVVVLHDEDLLGLGTAADASVACGLLGITRSLGAEGLRDGWAVNVLAASAEASDADRERWIERLAEPRGLRGGLVRLGQLHIGRVPV